MKDSKIISLEDTFLTHDDVRRLSEKLQKDTCDVISLRNCTVMDKDYKTIMKLIGSSRTVRHVALVIDQVTDKYRVNVLTKAILRNSSLAGLQ